MRFRYLAFLLLALLLLPLRADEAKSTRRILFLNSSDSRSAPYYEVLVGCNRVLAASKNIRIQADYEDLNLTYPNSYTVEEMALRMGPILQRLKGNYYDMVVTLGQGAVDVLASYNNYLSDEVGVIAVGEVIDSSKLLNLHRNFSEVSCEAGEEKCFELIFNLLPGTDCIFFVSSSTAEGHASRERVNKLLPKYPKLKCVFPEIGVSTLDEVADQIEIKGRGTVVILEGWKSNVKDQLELEAFLHRLRKMRAYTFTVTDGIFEREALGGAFAKSGDMGAALGNDIREALKRGNVCTGEKQRVLARNFVNSIALDSAGISMENLPLGIRRPDLNEFFQKGQVKTFTIAIWSTIGALVLLMVFALKMCYSRRFMKRTKAMLKLMPSRVMVSDANDKVHMLHYNDYLNFFMLGKRFDEMPVAILEELRSRARGVIESQENYLGTQEMEGRIYKVELLYMSKEKLGFEAVLWHLVDITDYAIASRHSRRDAQQKSNFVAMLSHEMRSLLDAIIGHSELLQQKNLDEKARDEYLYNINAVAKTLNTLLEETTDLTKLENNTLETHPVPTDVNEIANEVTKTYLTLANDKGLYLRFEPVPELPRVMIDSAHLRQILSIIVNNAVKYTERGGAVVRIKHSSSQNGNGINLIFEVEDTGVGIADEDRRGVFEPFEHGNIESKLRKKQGRFGLGLPVARSLARYIGGNVTFVSTRTKGSVFSVTFNALPLAEEKNEAPEKAQPKDVAVFNRAIVVAENPVTRSMFASMLRGRKIEVREVASADEVLGALVDFPADIIFTEYSMADMAGDELAQKLHCSPKYFNVKVIAVTADMSCADKSGDVFDGIIYKPVTKKKLALLFERLAK
ncbi:MAG: response regulator [Victivallales bacterium]|nr:response regulator [Victivallales bacterium]